MVSLVFSFKIKALVAWSGGIVSAGGVMGREIESRHGT
jgi:hypothetical protein